MKIVVLYRPESEHARATESFVEDYRRQGHDTSTLEVLNVDGAEGQAAAQLYGIMQYPAILALRDDGQLVKSWVGDEWPLLGELAYYASQM